MLKTLVIASVLKPVDEPRMFEKFGITLSEANKYDVNIIGFYSKKEAICKNVRIFPLFNFKRLSLKRLFVSFKYFKLLFKLKPELTIVNTHELLIVSVLYKIIFGGRLCYDICENYYRNTLHNTGWPVFMRPFLAFYVRAKEYALSPFIDGFILAERCYMNEFSFHRSKAVIIENKFKKVNLLQIPKKENPHPVFIHSGTISYNYGTLEAIELYQSLNRFIGNARLIIVGYCQNPKLLRRIKAHIKNDTSIKLIGGDHPVPHSTIIEQISLADFGLCPYHLDPSIENCIPTKFYEYMAFKVPIIIPDHEPWKKLLATSSACLSVDFKDYEASSTYAQLKQKVFYTEEVEESIYWKSEEEKLKSIVSELLKDVSSK